MKQFKGILESHGYTITKIEHEADEITAFNEQEGLYVRIEKSCEDVMFYYIDEDGEENSSIFISTKEAKLKNELMERIQYDYRKGKGK